MSSGSVPSEVAYSYLITLKVLSIPLIMVQNERYRALCGKFTSQIPKIFHHSNCYQTDFNLSKKSK